MIAPIIELYRKPVACPHCGYAHPLVTAVAQGSPNPFTFRISCPACGYTGELTKNLMENEQ